MINPPRHVEESEGQLHDFTIQELLDGMLNAVAILSGMSEVQVVADSPLTGRVVGPDGKAAYYSWEDNKVKFREQA